MTSASRPRRGGPLSVPGPVPRAPVVGVIGASGGVGASTLVCALARRASEAGREVVAVDGRDGGGLDVTACCEHLDGYRWGDLDGVRGHTDGERLVRRLPGQDGIRVLSTGGRPPRPDVVAEVVAALGEAADLVVVDLPVPGPQAPPSPGPADDGWTVDVLLVLCGLTPRRLADAERAVSRVLGRWGCGTGTREEAEGVDEVRRVRDATVSGSARAHGARETLLGLVTRGPRTLEDVPESVAGHLGLALAAHLPDDPRVALDEARGIGPGTRRRRAPSLAADSLLVWAGLSEESVAS